MLFPIFQSPVTSKGHNKRTISYCESWNAYIRVKDSESVCCTEFILSHFILYIALVTGTASDWDLVFLPLVLQNSQIYQTDILNASAIWAARNVWWRDKVTFSCVLIEESPFLLVLGLFFCNFTPPVLLFIFCSSFSSNFSFLCFRAVSLWFWNQTKPNQPK